MFRGKSAATVARSGRDLRQSTSQEPREDEASAAWELLGRAVRAWLKRDPDDATLATLIARAIGETDRVPDARRDDWQKLLRGFGVDVQRGPANVRARVEGLDRACRTFAEAAEIVRLDDPIDRLPGIGPKGKAVLAEEGILRVVDLVWTLPARYDDWSAPVSVAEAVATLAGSSSHEASGPRVVLPSRRVCLRGLVTSSTFVPMRGTRALRVVVADEENPKITVHAWWYFAAHGILAAARVGARVRMLGALAPANAGKSGKSSGPPRFAHAELLRDEDAVPVRPRYGRPGLADASLQRAIARAIASVDELGDPVPAEVARRESMADARVLIEAVHGQAGVLLKLPDDATRSAVRERLAWAEAFARVRDRTRAMPEGAVAAPALPTNRAVAARLVAELGFPLTAEQKAAIHDVEMDLAKTVPMRRLLFGDVGTGKTAVAMAALAQCVAAGKQAAVLAPTSVLAEQTMDALAPLARATGKSIALITGDLKAAPRARIEAAVADGSLPVVVGTHALLSEGLRFASLALVVVDEQHRLGVAQRLALVNKGSTAKVVKGKKIAPLVPHLLTLSATPIPRTLALALRGELATSQLGEKPRGRPPVTTLVRESSEADWLATIADLRGAIARGERSFFVTPRIGALAGKSKGAEEEPPPDEDESVPLPSAIDRHAQLAEVLKPAKVALLHGKMSGDAKRKAMQQIRSGEAQVLVATTVIEVGIDVPEATLMIVDAAERFGLAQLHQLRGRVGRGENPSRCILHASKPLEPTARARLDAMTIHSRGVDLARVDLALRGAGDLAGTRQSGAEEELLWLDPVDPPGWLERIEADTQRILCDDPELAHVEHSGLRRFVERLEARRRAGLLSGDVRGHAG